MGKLLLIDGNSMLFRAYFATAYGRPMSTGSGIPTNAIFGFANMLEKAVNVISPDYVFVAFDHDSDNFRRQEYAEYKGTRSETPDALVSRFPIAREYLDAMGIPQYEQHGIEADDIIGSMSRRYENEHEVSILTSDKDMLQLITDRTNVWLMKKGITEMERMDEAALYARFQLKPLQIIDLKGLSGDPSDNIPGVAGVGDKTAIKLLNQFDTVENLYDHIDEVKGKLRENLIRDREKAFLSKRLATIRTDAEIDVRLQEGTWNFASHKAFEFYTKYELRSFMSNRTITENTVTNKAEAVEKKNIKAVAVRNLNREFTDSLVAACLDEENGIGLANSTASLYISVSDAVMDPVFKEWLNSEDDKILYDVKRWYHLLDRYGLTIKGRIHDLMIMAFLVNSKVKTLKDYIVTYGIGAGHRSNEAISLFDDQPEADIDYSCAVARGLLETESNVSDQLQQESMNDLYWKVELPLAYILFDMEKAGVRVDASVLDRIAEETSAKLNELEKIIYQQAGRSFNINSPKQLAEVIYDDLGLMKSTKRSTDASVLKKLESRHPIISSILEYRKYAKLNSTYAVGLKKYITAESRIHTDYNQCITETGRLSSSNPNLQNISVRNEEASKIREAFIPDEGCVFVGADYSQVELRILAHMADEQTLIEAFRQGMDIHTRTAMDVFNVEKEEVTPLMRRQAKAINFGIDYGMTDFGLADRLGIPVWQAREFIESYYHKYPMIREFMNNTIELCQKQGYVTTLLNRRREIPEINSSNRSLKEFGKRAAMNAPIQGSAADLMKIAMINVFNRLKKEGLKSRMILQIHDEIILNVPLEEKDLIMKIVEEEMESAMELKVPLLAESTCGNTWLEVK